MQKHNTKNVTNNNLSSFLQTDMVNKLFTTSEDNKNNNNNVGRML